jgi:hypothetical protein
MRKRTKVIVAIAIFVAAAASCNLCSLREYCGVNLLWNDSEAYFFVGVGRQGYHVSCLRYPWLTIKEYLGAIESPDDNRAFLVVLRVTSSGVERHVLRLADRANGGAGSDPRQLTPLEGHIYAYCPNSMASAVGLAITSSERRKKNGGGLLAPTLSQKTT